MFHLIPQTVVATPLPSSTSLPQYVYYFVASVIVLVFIIIVQLVYVRAKLHKYSKDDYYKQLIVKNEYVDTQTLNSCSNFGVYGWQINTALAKYLNETSLKSQLFHLVKLPSYFYSIPTKLGFQSIEYAPTEVYFMPIATSSPATTRFIADLIAQRVDYVTWQTGLFRVSYLHAFKESVNEFLTLKGFKNVIKLLDNTTILALCKVPTLNYLKDLDYNFAQSIDEKSPDTLIQSFIGDSRQELNAENFPNSLQVVAYKV